MCVRKHACLFFSSAFVWAVRALGPGGKGELFVAFRSFAVRCCVCVVFACACVYSRVHVAIVRAWWFAVYFGT